MFNGIRLDRSFTPQLPAPSSFTVPARYSQVTTPARPVVKAGLSDQLQSGITTSTGGGGGSGIVMSNTQRPIQNPVQFVNIRQKSPIINISLQDLIPTYSNITENDLISYQVQYFDFPPQQPVTVKKGDKLELQIVSMWGDKEFATFSQNSINIGFYTRAMPYVPSFYTVHDKDDIRLEQGYQVPGGTYETMRRCYTYIYTFQYDLVCDQVAMANQLKEVLSQAAQEAAVELQAPPNGVYDQDPNDLLSMNAITQQQAYAVLSSILSIDYEPVSSRYMLQVDASVKQTEIAGSSLNFGRFVQTVDGLGPKTFKDCFLFGAKIRFRPHPGQTQEQIERVAVALGGKSALDSQNFVQGYYDTNFPENGAGTRTAQEINEVCNTIHSFYALDFRIGPTLTSGEVQNMQLLTPTDYMYAEEVMGALPYDVENAGDQLYGLFVYNPLANYDNRDLKRWLTNNYTYLLARTQARLFPDFSTNVFIYSHKKVSRNQTESDNFVYVHSSNTSTQWEVPGNFKSNVIAVLPRTKQAGGNEVPLFNDTLLQTSDYAVTIPISTMKTLELTLTDAEGNLIDFPSDYLLRLVVFPQLAGQ